MTGRGALRWAVALIAACAVAAAAFAYRFNTLGGTLGGFDNDEFAHLLRTDALLQGEQPLRDFMDSELRGAWPSLSYAVPAWAQQAWGRNLLAEAYLTAGALALAHALTFLLALDVSRWRWSLALLAAALAIATTPKLYNYPKVLILATGALAIRLTTAWPAWPTLLAAAVVTGIAVLFRHDYGVYVALGVVTGLVARDAGQWRMMWRRIGQYVASCAVVLLPSAVWVQRHEGIVPYLRDALATSRIEAGRTSLEASEFAFGQPWSEESLVAVTYHVFVALPFVALAVAALRMRVGRPIDARERGLVFALAAFALVVNAFFLRANLTQRFGDAVIAAALLAAWIGGQGWDMRSRPGRIALSAATHALLVVLLVSAFAYTGAARELRNTGLTESWDDVRTRMHAVREGLRQQPPVDWPRGVSAGRLEASRYLAECTAPSDRVLVAAYAPDIPVWARRTFAGGQPTYSLGFYTSDADQQRTLARLRAQSVPVILATEEFEDDFMTDYPLLARHVSAEYREAGTIPRDDRSVFRVFVEADRPVVRHDDVSGLPCYR